MCFNCKLLNPNSNENIIFCFGIYFHFLIFLKPFSVYPVNVLVSTVLIAIIFPILYKAPLMSMAFFARHKMDC